MAPLKLQDNPDIVRELSNPDPEVRAAVERLLDRIQSCQSTEELDQLASEYPHILFVAPEDENGISRVYGAHHIRRVAHA
jgi:hypothetical protein